jgi:hypothetical protein
MPQQMALVVDEMPDWLKGKEGARGQENVGSDDLVIPRLDVVQALSPYRKRDDPKFIKGAEEGNLINSVTLQNYGESVIVVPLYYRKDFLVWKDRKKDPSGQGGFYGAYRTQEEARARISQESPESQPNIVIVDTPLHFCLLLNGDRAEEIVLSMPRSKAKHSRRWNSLVKLAGGDSFSRAYRIKAQFEKGAKGDFYNFDIQPAGFPSKGLYDKAESIYKAFASGERKFEVKHEEEDESAGSQVVEDF